MDATTLRKLAIQTLRLAGMANDEEEAAKLRLQAADYLEKADELARLSDQIDEEK